MVGDFHGDVVLGVGGRRVLRTEHEEFAALAFVRPWLAHVRHRALPEIVDESGDRSGWYLDDERAGLRQIEPAQRVGRRDVRGEEVR